MNKLGQEELRQEKIALLERAKSGDSFAYDTFFEQNQGLIHMAVKRFVGRGTEYDDLFQIASLAFVKAVRNFDLEAGVQFSTYAIPVMLGELKRHFRDYGTIRVSRSIKEANLRISKITEEYYLKHGEHPTMSELAKESGIEESELAFIMGSQNQILSLSYLAFEDGGELLDMLGTDTTEEEINRISIDNALKKLPEKERRIMLLRYFGSRTQQETAKELGISQVQVSRAEKKVLMKLRELMRER